MMARKEHTTSRVGHHVQVLVVVSGGDSSTTFNGARLRRGIVNPQVPSAGRLLWRREAAARTNNRHHRSQYSERQPKC